MASILSLSGRPKIVALTATTLALLLAGVVVVRGSAPAADWSLTLPSLAPYGPGVGEGRIAFCTKDETLRVLDSQTGVELWNRPGLRAYATPVVHRDRVLVATLDYTLVAFDLASGDELWTVDAGGGRMLAVWGDELVVGRNTGFDVRAFETGRLDWEYRPSEDGLEGNLTEAISVADGVVFVAFSIKSNFGISFGNRSVVAGGVYAVDLGSGRQAWVSPIEDRVRHSPIVHDGTVVAATSSGLVNEVYGLDAKTGALRWKHVGASGTPRVIEDTVCFVNVDSRTGKSGPVPLLEEKYSYIGLDLATGEEEWSRGAAFEPWQSQDDADLVFFGYEDTVQALGGESGSRSWRLSLESDLSAPLASADGRLFVFTEDSQLKSYSLR